MVSRAEILDLLHRQARAESGGSVMAGARPSKGVRHCVSFKETAKGKRCAKMASGKGGALLGGYKGMVSDLDALRNQEGYADAQVEDIPADVLADAMKRLRVSHNDRPLRPRSAKQEAALARRILIRHLTPKAPRAAPAPPRASKSKGVRHCTEYKQTARGQRCAKYEPGAARSPAEMVESARAAIAAVPSSAPIVASGLGGALLGGCAMCGCAPRRHYDYEEDEGRTHYLE